MNLQAGCNGKMHLYNRSHDCCQCGKLDPWPDNNVPYWVEAATNEAKTIEATKHDSSKPGMELLSTAALVEIAKVLDFGKKKYAAHNWRKGMAWSRVLGAAMRHLTAFNDGEDKDPESGLSHMAHLGCCVLFLLEYETKKLGTDDRYKGQPE